MTEDETTKKPVATGRLWRTIAIIAVAAAFIVLIITSVVTKPSISDQIWNEAATIGKLDAKNYYIMYTDLLCPYCTPFSRAVLDHWDEFQQYLEENDILFEVRLTDYIYFAYGSQYSHDSAEAAYCAMRENKFWDFYHGAVAALWRDYQSKGIGVSKTSPTISDLPDDYWLKIGHEAGLGEDFDTCIANHAVEDELTNNTRRALQVAEGMPFFKFNDFTLSGFDTSWGWDYVLRYLDAGLAKK